MVDLRQALKPANIAAPLPVREIAARAARRRRRRRAMVVGLSAGTATVGLLAAAMLATGSTGAELSTVTAAADPPGSPPTETSPSAEVSPSTETSGTPPGSGSPTTTAAVGDAPAAGTDLTVSDATTSPDLRITSETTSAWEDGYCVRVRVDNDGDSAVDWEVSVEHTGTIETLWNAATGPYDGGAPTFTGSDWNATLQPGAWTTFGMCLDTGPPSQP